MKLGLSGGASFFSSQELRDWWNIETDFWLTFFHPRNYVIDEMIILYHKHLFFIPGITWLMKSIRAVTVHFFSSQELRDWWNNEVTFSLPFFHPRNYVIDEILKQKVKLLFFIPGITWLMKLVWHGNQHFFSSQELRDWWNRINWCIQAFFHPRNYVIDEICDISRG